MWDTLVSLLCSEITSWPGNEAAMARDTTFKWPPVLSLLGRLCSFADEIEQQAGDE